MKKRIKQLLNNHQVQEIYTCLQVANEVMRFAQLDSKEDRLQYFCNLLKGPDDETAGLRLIGTRILSNTTAHKKLIAKLFKLSPADREELLEFFYNCITDEDLRYSLYDYMDKNLPAMSLEEFVLPQVIEIKGEPVKRAATQRTCHHMERSFIPDEFHFSSEEHDILIDAGYPFFNAIQSHRTVSVAGFKRFLAQKVDREDCVSFERGSQVHLALLEKLEGLNPYQMELVFRGVMLSRYYDAGEFSEINIRLTQEQIREILKPFHAMHQLALLEAAQNCVSQVSVGVKELIESLRYGIIYADSQYLIDGSCEHRDLLVKFDALDEDQQRNLASACSLFWLDIMDEDTHSEQFDWISDNDFPMSVQEYVLSQLRNRAEYW